MKSAKDSFQAHPWTLFQKIFRITKLIFTNAKHVGWMVLEIDGRITRRRNLNDYIIIYSSWYNY